MNDLEYFTEHILPPLQSNEVYFLSASARNKYLDKDEREKYSLGRTEMMLRKVARSKEQYIHRIEEIQYHLKGYKTRSGLIVPPKATIIYTNINPSNTIKAYNSLQATANHKIMEALTNPNNSSTSDYFTRIEQNIMTEIQRAPGRKTWIDVDFDVNNEDPVARFHEELVSHQVRHYTIKTKSGYHVLIDRNTVDYNFHKTVTELNKEYGGAGGEVILNKNAMVPTPGTLQGGHMVKILHTLSKEKTT